MRKSSRQAKDGFPGADHDHDSCVAEAMGKAAEVCAQRQVRLTPLRRRVLEVVWSSHKPMGAYDILGVLAGERGSAAPPTVYRALDFLLENGLVHRIESLNAFVGCTKPDHDHAWQFLICRACGRAVEISEEALEKAIAGAAARTGFTIQRRTIELAGLCSACREGQGQGNDGNTAR